MTNFFSCEETLTFTPKSKSYVFTSYAYNCLISLNVNNRCKRGPSAYFSNSEKF